MHPPHRETARGRRIADRVHPCDHHVMSDPIVTDPQLYRVLFENDQVRVLEYRDRPGDRTHPHDHPNSVMYSMSSFRRRLEAAGQQREVEIGAGTVSWLPAQSHSGENIGDTETVVLFVELKESDGQTPSIASLGPQV